MVANLDNNLTGKDLEAVSKWIILGKKNNWFYCGDGTLSSDFEDVYLFGSEEAAKEELSYFDEPDEYKIWQVTRIV